MLLYQEVIENEKGRLDLFKWKVVLVAGLGAAASGLVGTKPVLPVLPLALIPLVCVYVDLLSLDLTLRICVISRYFSLVHRVNGEPTDTQYAAFVGVADQMKKAPKSVTTLFTISNEVLQRLRQRNGAPSAYTFVFLAQGLSTFLLSLGVLSWGAFFLPLKEEWVLAVSVFIGAAYEALSYLEFKRRTLAIGELELE
jgi:hypothetical protein